MEDLLFAFSINGIKDQKSSSLGSLTATKVAQIGYFSSLIPFLSTEKLFYYDTIQKIHLY